jgi:hypothetical protein
MSKGKFPLTLLSAKLDFLGIFNPFFEYLLCFMSINILYVEIGL